MDALFLSRCQFALTSMFHYIYPPMSIGLGLILIITEGLYIKTGKAHYKTMTKFLIKIFSLTFALGVATGLVQLFGFGTNWASYSRFVGDVFGSALGAEGIFAFFLEAGFLGIVLFGWEKVSAKMHYFATICVAAGAHFSALWIVIANSWMQTPAGYRIEGSGASARAVVTNFWEMIFNPSSLDRVSHVIIGCWLSGIFLTISISAYYLLKKEHLSIARSLMKISLGLAAFVLTLQLISGDSSARVVAKYQPAKLAAMEGVYKTEERTPAAILGWVDEKNEKVVGLQIPGLLSLMTYRNMTTPVTGLDQIPQQDRPKVAIVFQTYHIMIYMWATMALLTLLAIYYYRKKRLEKKRWLLIALTFSVLCPHIANQVGWMTAELGRQPWLVQGLLRTADGVSKSLNLYQVVLSLTLFFLIYCFLFALFIFLLNQKIKDGPLGEDETPVYRSDASIGKNR